jgi:thioesterase domain-containing protein
MLDLLEDPARLSPRLQEVMMADIEAGHEYVPRAYPGRVTLFRVQKMDLLRAYDPLIGWGRLAKGGVDLHIIAGDHESVLHPPYVNMLAEQVQSYLR